MGSFTYSVDGFRSLTNLDLSKYQGYESVVKVR